jgi:hypothetical protein
MVIKGLRIAFDGEVRPPPTAGLPFQGLSVPHVHRAAPETAAIANLRAFAVPVEIDISPATLGKESDGFKFARIYGKVHRRIPLVFAVCGIQARTYLD